MTNKKKPLVVPCDIVLNETHYDNIELTEDGCLKIIVGPETKEITIGTLKNSKKNPVIFKYDILVTSLDGTNAPAGSGLSGSDATNAGEVYITVENLIDDVSVFIRGANGGNGGSGSIISEKEGANGGNGGNGGNGAKVIFNYGKKSKGKPQIFEIKTGFGGNGGDGGICPTPIGKGGTPSTEPTIGGKNGNGGKAGKNGEIGSFTAKETESKNHHFVKLLDLSNEEDYNLFLEHRGGEKSLKKYPNIWALIQKDRNNNKFNNSSESEDIHIFDDSGSHVFLNRVENSNKNNLLSSNDESYVFNIQNTMSLYNCRASDAKTKKILGKKPSVCVRDMIIKEKGTNKKLGHIPFRTVFNHPYYICEDVNSDSIKAADILKKDVIIEALYTYYYDDESIPSQNVICQYSTFSTGDQGFLYKNFKVTDPIYKALGKSNGDIKILYGRTTANYEDADYVGDSPDGKYYSNRIQNGNKVDIPTTIIPIKGIIYFKPNSEFKLEKIDFIKYTEDTTVCPPKLTYSNETANFLVQIGGDNKELLEKVSLKEHFDYHIDDNDDSKSYVIFDIYIDKSSKYGKYDWNAQVVDASFYDHGDIHTSECFLVCDIPFKMTFRKSTDDPNKPHQSHTRDAWISIRGNDNAADGRFFESKEDAVMAYIPPIMICWGCYATDTLIQTVDGLKKACDIKEGDKLPVYGDKILTISDVYVGEDKWICHIKTTDQKSIRVSADHAMKLYCENKSNGKKIPAGRIKKGDILMVPEGTVEVESVDIEAYNDKVYNFQFKEEKTPNYINANGFWSGDINAQNESEPIELSAKAKAICEELKLLEAELSKKDQQ